jgi:hypothetical protein
MKCLWCSKKIVPKKVRGRIYRTKFCSLSCRSKHGYHGKYGSDYQREQYQRDLIETHGKEKLIECQICHDYFRQVGSHVFLTHNITARKYRKIYGFDVKRGILPPDYRERKGKIARDNGTAENVVEAGKPFLFKKGQKGIGKYKRSRQTMKRLRNMPQQFKPKLKPGEREEITRLYNKGNITLSEIAKIFNVSIALVSLVCKRSKATKGVTCHSTIST